MLRGRVVIGEMAESAGARERSSEAPATSPHALFAEPAEPRED